MPCTRVVLPAPSSPVSATASRGRKRPASASPTARVSSAAVVRSSMRIRRAPTAPRPAARGRSPAARDGRPSPASLGRLGSAGGGGATRAPARRLGRASAGPASVRCTSAKSSRMSWNCGDFSPPPCRIAAGWNVGITVRPCHECTVPRIRVMPCVVCSTYFVAKLPSVTIRRGWMIEICSTSHGVHASISSGSGSRLPGGRLFKTFAM